MAERPLTDAELHAFLALDDARTAGEWEWEAPDESYMGLGVKGTALMEGAVLGCARCDACQGCGKLCDWPKQPDADYIAGCTRMARRMAEELLRLRQAEACMWQDVQRIHGKAGDDFAPDDAPVYRQDDPTVYHTDHVPEDPPCPVCGGRGRCTFTRGRLAEVRELTVHDWREVHDFTVRVFMPFVHGIIARAKVRAEGS